LRDHCPTKERRYKMDILGVLVAGLIIGLLGKFVGSYSAM
jgi:hypothetical protein